MGMGFMPCNAWVLEEPQKIAIELKMDKWLELMDDELLEEFVRYGDDFEFDENIINNFKAKLVEICEEFKNKTNLEINPFYYSSEDGNRYDDLTDGVHWEVFGVSCLTPAGLAAVHQGWIKLASWTVFG